MSDPVRDAAREASLDARQSSVVYVDAGPTTSTLPLDDDDAPASTSPVAVSRSGVRLLHATERPTNDMHVSDDHPEIHAEGFGHAALMLPP
jgi:hypothetical protein